MNLEKRYALLIDADNISPKYIDLIMRLIAEEGKASIRRIYGDWTDSSKCSWKECLLDNSLIPVQQYSYTTGKNSSDATMIIDAMDILYTNDVDGYVIASSDSDFTRLAERLRESGKRVIGMGERKTPSAFIRACEQFKTLDVLLKGELEELKGEIKGVKNRKGISKKQTRESVLKENTLEPITSLKDIKKTIISRIEESADDWIYLGDLGNMLTKIYPDFDCRNYGYPKFAKMVNSFPELETDIRKSSNEITTLVYVKCRD